MKKKLRLTIPHIIMICMCLVLLFMVAAQVWNRSQIQAMTPDEVRRYSLYQVTPPAGVLSRSGEDITDEDLLSFCTEKPDGADGEGKDPEYTSDQLPAWLPEYRELISIQKRGSDLHLSYETTGDLIVDLVYDEEGLCRRFVYDAAVDTSYMIDREEQTKIEHYMNVAS